MRRWTKNDPASFFYPKQDEVRKWHAFFDLSVLYKNIRAYLVHILNFSKNVVLS